jgi:hypothetical protein
MNKAGRRKVIKGIGEMMPAMQIDKCMVHPAEQGNHNLF